MTINKAVEHFIWKLKNKWSPTKADQDAINTIIDFVEDKHKQQFNDNQLFAKLYIYVFGEYLNYYQCSVFNDDPQIEIHKLLDTPIEQVIKNFTVKANDVERILKMKLAGIANKSPLLKTEDEHKKEDALLTLEMFKDEMTVEEATTNLTSMINLALNKFS